VILLKKVKLNKKSWWILYLIKTKQCFNWYDNEWCI
jgi:hypothetical protein